MKTCALCRKPWPADALDRISGLDLCGNCRLDEPTRALGSHGIIVEWDVRLGWFNAGLGLPNADADFHLSCVPEMITHKILKWVVHEVEVGDPAFDKAVYVRTSDRERAAKLLANEGLQSCMLTFLTAVRVNELASNHVTLKGPTLTLASRPLGSLPPERVQALKVETAVLALHLA